MAVTLDTPSEESARVLTGVTAVGLRPLDGVVAGVGPVNVAVVHGDAMGSGYAGGDQVLHAAGSVGILAPDLVVAVVAPIDVVAVGIDGEIVGAAHLRVVDHRLRHAGPVQAGALDLRVSGVQPVVPVHRAGSGEDCAGGKASALPGCCSATKAAIATSMRRKAIPRTVQTLFSRAVMAARADQRPQLLQRRRYIRLMAQVATMGTMLATKQIPP